MNEIDFSFARQAVADTGAWLLQIFEMIEQVSDREARRDAARDIRSVASERIRSTLARRYPGIAWQAGGDAYWRCDPLEGDEYFFRQLPLWAVSLALVENGRPCFAIVFDPVHRESFDARHGFGVRMNGCAMQASRVRDLSDAIVAGPAPGGVDSASIGAVAGEVFELRTGGPISLQLAQLAAGRIDAVWSATDAAASMAGRLLASEAGALVTDLRGKSLLPHAHGMLAARHPLHAPLLRLLDHGENRLRESACLCHLLV